MDFDVRTLGTILSLWAHPDDETYLAGGLMAAATSAGQRVVCVSLTAGERGTSDPGAWPAERLARLRRWEAAAAMAVLGIDDHRILDLPDGGLVGIDEGAGTDLVGALIDEVEPDTIVTFGPDGITFHPDHIAVSRWATEAWERRGRRERLLYAARTKEHLARFDQLYEREGFYMTEQRLAGVVSDEVAVGLTLEGPVLDRKLSALAAIASQTHTLIARVGRRGYAAFNSDETFVDAARKPSAGTAPTVRNGYAVSDSVPRVPSTSRAALRTERVRRRGSPARTGRAVRHVAPRPRNERSSASASRRG